MKQKTSKSQMLILFLSMLCVISSPALHISGSTQETPGPRPEEDLFSLIPENRYELIGSAEVNGRQGVCCENGFYWVSGSASLAKYDSDWNLIAENTDPFKGYELEVNHIGDIDVYQNELYVGAEYFMDGVGKNIQIAVYDGDTLEMLRTFPFEPESGQLECSGIAVHPYTRSVWMCSWAGEESSRYLYEYDLETGAYLRKVHMQMPPQWIQGMAYHDDCFYLTADDGTADDDEPDHLYRTKIESGAANCTVTLERTFDDVTRQGEIEGLTFDEENGRLLVLYNRGARIILGMPKGFYEGYDREISEVFTYQMSDRVKTEQLKIADAEVQEKYEAFDPEDSTSVREMVLALNRMKNAVTDLLYKEDHEWYEKETLSIDGAVRNVRFMMEEDFVHSRYICMKNGKTGVIWSSGGDAYTYDFVVDGTLIGYHLGYSDGEIGFSAQIPDWIQNPDGEEISLLYGKSTIWTDRQANYEEEAERIRKMWEKAVSMTEPDL